ncbi:unnamed protein product [Cylicocyclus nassatus]|uniref:Uncharacterized protein n=1 Tax=Cylicocyclus nassatus TaxID=53992 RepID=A0AA36H0P3_CYLNA|nr:unnamed protein product [Cylicocyclus nassatus]
MNNPYEVQRVAKQSPQTRTIDYTSYKAPRSERKSNPQKFEQSKTTKQGQISSLNSSKLRNDSATTAQPNNQGFNSQRNGISALVYNTAEGTLIVPVLPSFLYGGAANGLGGNFLGSPIQVIGNPPGQAPNGAGANINANQQKNAETRTSFNVVNPPGVFAGAPIFIPDLNGLFGGNLLLPNLQQVNQQGRSDHTQREIQPPSYQAPRPDPTSEDNQSNYDNQQPTPTYSTSVNYSTPPSTAVTFPTLMTSPTPPAPYNSPEPINPYRRRRH